MVVPSSAVTPHPDRVRADFQIDLEALRVGVGVGQQLAVAVEVGHLCAVRVGGRCIDGDLVDQIGCG